MKKTKILHIAQPAGGVDKYLKLLLSNDKINDNVLVCSFDYNVENYRLITKNIFQINILRDVSFLSDIKNVFKIRKIINAEKPDILYLHSSKAGFVGRIANIGLSNKCIYNPHGWAFNMVDKPIKIRIYKLVEKILSFFCQKIICISIFEKESAVANKICKSDKLALITNGILIEDNFSLQKNDDEVIIGMVGRISKQKSPDLFVKMAYEIKKSVPNANFIIVGDGPLRNEIVNEIIELDLYDSFEITGWVDNVSDYIDKFDVAILLSRWEGFGLVLPEYMSRFKPIVATNVDAIPSIILDGVNGYLVENEDYIDAANKVIEILNNADLRNRFCKNGIDIIRTNFSIDRVIKEHELLYNNLLNTK